MVYPMETDNSLVVYTTLLRRLLYDVADCYSDSEATLDWNKIQKRFDYEGIAFLTKGLPRLGKAFDKALLGNIPLTAIGFSNEPARKTPKFLGWLFRRIFYSDGMIRSDADPYAIKSVRQILYFLYKLELPSDEEVNRKTIDNFVTTDTELERLDIDSDAPWLNTARGLISRALQAGCPRDILPRHGPGAVSTGERGAEKSAFRRLYLDHEHLYPFTEYNVCGLTQVVDTIDKIQGLEVLEYGTAKVVLVPKDSRGPRIISCEPLEKQWLQQGLQRKLYATLESSRLTGGFVNFTDQTINRALALRSSVTQKWVTLDMKDASDRVSTALVSVLFKDSGWLDALLASRSKYTTLPDGRLIKLNKFAPMGSAVCFPVEALCFWALAVSTLIVYNHVPPRVAKKRVYVYGDDLIVREEDYSSLLTHFPKVGLMFNVDKCCTAGFFRESCGCDAYKGVDVTPLRLKSLWSHTRSASILTAYVSYSNEAYARGYRRLSEGIKVMVESLYGPLPHLDSYRRSPSSDEESLCRKLLKYRLRRLIGHPPSPEGRPSYSILGWDRPDVNAYKQNLLRSLHVRWNTNLQRREVRSYSSSSVLIRGPETGWDRLTRTLCSGQSAFRVGTYAVAHRSRLKRAWGTVV